MPDMCSSVTGWRVNIQLYRKWSERFLESFFFRAEAESVSGRRTSAVSEVWSGTGEMGCPWYKAVWVRKSLNKHLQRKGSIKALFISIWRIGTALIIETDPSGPHLSLPSLPKQSGALTDTQSWLKVEGCSGCVPKYELKKTKSPPTGEI